MNTTHRIPPHQGKSFTFDKSFILDYLDVLKPDGGSETKTEKSFHCPLCNAKNFKVNILTGKYSSFSCSCALTKAGKRQIKKVLAPLAWKKPIRPKGRQTFTYYAQKNGRAVRVAQVVRTDNGEGKRGFSQRHWNGKRWINGLPDAVKPNIHLYRIFDKTNQAAKGKQIFLVEGEGKVEALLKLGIPATSIIGGAEKWQNYGYPNYLEDLQDYQVVLCPDRDKPGVRHCQEIEADLTAHDIEVAGWLYAFPTSYLWNRLPESSGTDIANWIEAGATRDDILRAVEPRRELAESPQLQQIHPEQPERKTVTDSLREIALKECDFFHTPDRQAFADVVIEGTRQTFPIRRKSFRQWLSREYYKVTDKGAGAQSLQDTLGLLEAIAAFDGEERAVHLRLAEHEDRLYLDLGRDDWTSVAISRDRWEVIPSQECPVRFLRPDTQLALPIPKGGGHLEELRALLNVDENAWVLILAWLLFSFYPKHPHPVLILHGEQGSGKSSTAQLLKSLVDPSKAPLIPAIADLRNHAITNSRRWIVAYDNLSGISAEKSDAICRTATGAGFPTRTLHENDEETVFEFVRPQILTGIDSLATRGDLLERSILVNLKPIPADNRMAEAELERHLEATRPRLLGALLTAVSQTLAVLPTLEPGPLPRMADFARFAIAAELAMGLESGAFMAAYQGNHEEHHEIALESSPLGIAIQRLMDGRVRWQGTATELLIELSNFTDERMLKSKRWPGDGTRLSKALTRLAPDLRGSGIDYLTHRTGGRRQITLEKLLEVASSPSLASSKASNPDGKGLSTNDAKPQNGDASDANFMTDVSASPSVTPSVSSETFSAEGFQPFSIASDANDTKNGHSSTPCINTAELEEW